MKRLLYILPFLFAALVSCEREIPYNGEYQDPKLVIHAALNAEADTIICNIDRSYFFLEQTNPNNKEETIKNPTIEVQSAQNKSLQIVSRYQKGNEHKIYLSHPLQANDTIRLIVTHPKYGTAVAEDVVMPKLKVTLKSSVWEPKKKQCRFVFDLPDSYPMPQTKICLQGEAFTSQIRIITQYDKDGIITSCDTSVQDMRYVMIRSKNTIFAGQENKFDTETGCFGGTAKLMLNADKLPAKEVEIILALNYLSYDTTMVNEYSTGKKRITYSTYTIDACNFTFSAQSPTCTLYMNSMAAYWGVDEDYYDEMDLGAMLSGMIGMEEPVAVYSNVEGGYGILFSNTQNRINIPQLLPQ